jgi:GH25 family lysozyme M1 (1,4-beta-N-acetylmuramidase)
MKKEPLYKRFGESRSVEQMSRSAIATFKIENIDVSDDMMRIAIEKAKERLKAESR